MSNKNLEIIDCGTIEYGEAWALQKKYFEARLSGSSMQNVLLYSEHPHVYTLGKSGHEENFLISDEFLKTINASYFRTDRGGDITYHGYGQLVGYPILKVSDYNLSLRDYIFTIEEAVIMLLAEYGIKAYRISSATGVWVTECGCEKKICAIGVKASRFITMHGFALNVTTDLSYFNYINPCGFTDKGVTSIEAHLRATNINSEINVTLEEVKRLFSAKFTELLCCETK